MIIIIAGNVGKRQGHLLRPPTFDFFLRDAVGHGGVGRDDVFGSCWIWLRSDSEVIIHLANRGPRRKEVCFACLPSTQFLFESRLVNPSLLVSSVSVRGP